MASEVRQPNAEERAGRYLTALADRHLRDLKFAEVSRALRALSAGYVEKRDAGGLERALDGRGKKAAFGLYYGAIHFAATMALVREFHLQIDRAVPGPIVDLGCGTGVCGAAWAIESGRSGPLQGVDRSPFARHEADWTYRTLGLRGHTHSSIADVLARAERPCAVVLGFALNELDETLRGAIGEHCLRAQGGGARILVIEPISKRVAPWWVEWTAPFLARGARVVETRLSLELPQKVALLGRAAGLRPDSIAVRALAS
jgi:hypothetical protein